jgi:hypothetical protein
MEPRCHLVAETDSTEIEYTPHHPKIMGFSQPSASGIRRYKSGEKDTGPMYIINGFL